jgi:hypothetical protein
MSFIKSRLRRVEASVRGGPCPECNLSPRDKGYMVVEGALEGKDPAPDVPEVCPKCGRNTKVHLRVLHDGNEAGEEGEG